MRIRTQAIRMGRAGVLVWERGIVLESAFWPPGPCVGGGRGTPAGSTLGFVGVVRALMWGSQPMTIVPPKQDWGRRPGPDWRAPERLEQNSRRASAPGPAREGNSCTDARWRPYIARSSHRCEDPPRNSLSGRAQTLAIKSRPPLGLPPLLPPVITAEGAGSRRHRLAVVPPGRSFATRCPS